MKRTSSGPSIATRGHRIGHPARSRRAARLHLAAMAVMAAMPAVSGATTLFWDPNGNTGLGGSGSWDLTTPAWSTTNAMTPTPVIWTQGDDANFAGTAGTVTLGTTINAGAITVANPALTPAYSFTGGTLGFTSFTTPTVTGVSTINMGSIMSGGGANDDLTFISTVSTVGSVINDTAASNAFTGNINLNTGTATLPTASSGRLQITFNATAQLPSTAAINFNRDYAQIGFSTVDFGTVNNNFHINNSGMSGNWENWIGNGVNVTLGGVISGAGGLTIGINGSGGASVMTLTNNETYTGITKLFNTATGGVLRMGVDNALPATTDVTWGSGATPGGALDLNGHNLAVASLVSGVTTGAQNGVTNTAGALSTLTISGASTSTYSGTIGMSPNTTNLAGSSDNIKVVLASTNVGQQTFNNANGMTYTQGTQINGGKLIVSNTAGSGTGTGAVNIGANGRLGSGTGNVGIVTGHVDNSGTILPGNANIGTMSLAGGLTAEAGSNVSFNFNGSNSMIALNGANDAAILSTPGGTGAATITLNDLGSAIQNNTTYNLFSYPATTTLAGLDLSKFHVVSPTGVSSLATFQLVNDATDHLIQVEVNPLPTGGIFGTQSTWTGAISNNWTTVPSDTNFTNGSAISYNNPDEVTFDDNGPGGLITLGTGIAPGKVTVTTVTKNYTFSGGIGGTGPVIKNPGLGVLVLTGTNTYSGGTTLIGGTASVATGSTLAIDGDAAARPPVPATPSINLTIVKSGVTTLRFDSNMTLSANRIIDISQINGGGGPTFSTNGHNVTIAGSITATGSVNLVKGGTGTLVLRGDNSNTIGGAAIGVIQITGGTLNVASDNNIGKSQTSTAGTGFSISGAASTLQLGASFPWTVGAIAIVSTGGGIDTNGFNETVPTVVSSSPIAATVVGFEKQGLGTLTLSATNTYTYPTYANGGLLEFTQTNAYTTTNNIQANAGGAVGLDTSSLDPAFIAKINATHAGATGAAITVPSVGSLALAPVDAASNIDFTGTVGGAANLSGTNSAGMSIGAIGTISYTGTITPNVSLGYRLGGGGTLVLPVPASAPTALTGINNVTITNGGTVVLAAANDYVGTTTVDALTTLSVGNDAYMGNTTNALAFTGGTLLATGTLNSGARNVTVGAGGGTLNPNGNLVTLGNLSTSGTFKITPSGLPTGSAKAVRVGTVSVSAGAVDITDNKLITSSPVGTLSGNTYSDVSGLVQAGRNGGSWNGMGILTSQTAAKSPNFLTTVAVASAADAKGISGTQTALFGGQTVHATDTLVMYTYAGDANLDGKIDADDYFQIDSNYNKSGSRQRRLLQRRLQLRRRDQRR